MATTYELIQAVTVSASTVTSIDFTSIPTTYTDLVLRLSTRHQTADYLIIFNSNTSSGLTRHMYGDSTSGGAYTNSGVTGYVGLTSNNAALADTFGNAEIYIPNYNSTSVVKNMVVDSIAEGSARSSGYQFMSAATWGNTAAITSISIRDYDTNNGNIKQKSTAYLYGIKNT